jgi:hypothetical protein
MKTDLRLNQESSMAVQSVAKVLKVVSRAIQD